MSKWISVKDNLPVIPEGQYAVSVLVAVYDYMYHESCGPKGAYTVCQIHYAKLNEHHKEGWELILGTSENMPEEEFVTRYSSGNDKGCIGPIIDEVTHWMYLPEPPEVPPLKDSESE